jgi:two-component system, NtrC family, sensor kinase
VVAMNTSAEELLRPEVYSAAMSDPGHPLHTIAELDAMPSTLAAPMFAGGNLVGVLVLHQDRSYRFDAEDHRVVRIFAQEAGLAIRTQALLDEAQHRADALESSEGRYRAFVQQITDAMFRLDTAGVVEEVSDFGVALLGKSREELLGHTVCAFVAQPDREALRRAVAEAAEGRSCELSINVAQSSGKARVAIFRLGPLTHKDTVVGIIGVARDDTDRRALQGKVLVREKLASVGLLSAGVAHEIYNPLSFLVSNLDTLEEDVRARRDGNSQFSLEEYLEMLGECREGTRRIRTIVSNLRQFSLEGTEVDHQEVLLNQTVESATWMVYLSARMRTHIQLELDPDVGMVECLPGQVVQSVAQLLSNAIRASLAVDRSAPEVVLQTVRAGDFVEIRVIDRGCGIPAEDLIYVAEPFFTTNDSEGAGVGLTIVLDTARHHGGTLRLRSAEAGGTVATLILPVRQDPDLRREEALDLGRNSSATPP